ncbi:hypothetical protein [Intestinimonas sp. MSJ-38]|uniref:hypothetical protein n=1 Tax=Intestinimonas sp. MSJ-38 TaxID=2841532 RepID=UPI001C12918C|nr:hypothetical protein [Intestinimonas sp. MSJ-38]MBU5432898.1 hypothetical protein [Intestinimonas sp. MSJ-38]
MKMKHFVLACTIGTLLMACNIFAADLPQAETTSPENVSLEQTESFKQYILGFYGDEMEQYTMFDENQTDVTAQFYADTVDFYNTGNFVLIHEYAKNNLSTIRYEEIENVIPTHAGNTTYNASNVFRHFTRSTNFNGIYTMEVEAKLSATYTVDSQWDVIVSATSPVVNYVHYISKSSSALYTNPESISTSYSIDPNGLRVVFSANVGFNVFFGPDYVEHVYFDDWYMSLTKVTDGNPNT